MSDRDRRQVEAERVILDQIAQALIGIASADRLVEKLGYPDQTAFCKARGCGNLMDYFFDDDLFARVRGIRRELACGEVSD